MVTGGTKFLVEYNSRGILGGECCGERTSHEELSALCGNAFQIILEGYIA